VSHPFGFQAACGPYRHAAGNYDHNRLYD